MSIETLAAIASPTVVHSHSTMVVGLVISSFSTIVAVIGIGWFGLDRLEQRIKTDSQRAHDLIGTNIKALQSEVSDARSEVSGMRKEITGLTGRVGRIEGLLEGMRNPQ